MILKHRIIMYDENSIGIGIHLRRLGEKMSELANDRNECSDALFVHNDSLLGKCSENKNDDTVDLADLGYNVKQLMKKYRPTALVTVHQGNFITRALTRQARKLGVPSVYFQHAYVGEKDKKRVVSRGALKKYLTQLYAYSMVKPYALFTPSVIGYLVKGAMGGRVLRYPPLPGIDNRCDIALVRNQYFREYAVNCLGYSVDRVIISGNPEIERYREHINRESRNAIYVMQPLVEDGILSKQLYWEFLQTFSDTCNKFRIKAFPKPHPRSDASIVKLTCEILGSQAVSDDSGLSRDFFLAVGHNSALLPRFFAMKIPVISFWPESLDTSVIEPYAFRVVRNVKDLSQAIASVLLNKQEVEDHTSSVMKMLYDEGEIANDSMGALSRIATIILDMSRGFLLRSV